MKKLTISSSIKFIMSLVLTLSLGGIFIACQDELVIRENVDPVSEDGILFTCSDMINVYDGQSGTRASTPKEEKEKEIKTLHIFFFRQSDSTLMKTTQYHNFTGYMKTTSGFLNIPTPQTDKPLFEGGDDVTVFIVALANIDATEEAVDANAAENSFFTDYSPSGKIAQKSREKGAAPWKITKYSDLENWVYYPRLRVDESTGKEDVRNLPKAGMPMIGKLRDVKLNKKPATPYVVEMEALMAKVVVTVELKPDQYIGDLPEIVIDSVGIKNMPVAVPFIQPTGMRKGAKTLTRPTDYNEYITDYDVTNVPMVHPGTIPHDDEICGPENHEAHECIVKLEQPLVVNRKTDPAVIKYYTYENIQLPNYDAKSANDKEMFPNKGMTPAYPDSVTKPEQKQRWKSVIAHKNRASALILKGTFTTHQEVDYQAKFTVYMGGDAETDFQVKRNHRYDNNITIYGLEYMRNSDDDVYNYDGRLDVVSDNPIYLAVVNERNIDAHATCLPVDVWLMMWEDALKKGEGNPDVDWHSEVTFTIDDYKNHTWIRMDKVIPRSTMEGSGWKAGTGARDYFTETLMDELASNTTLTVTSKDHGSRSRVYFYINENVPIDDKVNTTDPKASNYYGDREAKIKVHYARYKNSDNSLVEDRDYELDIRQRALVRVSGQRYGRTDTKENVPDTWMEYYEEYLTHNDPLERRGPTGEYYSGLSWGPSRDCSSHWSNESGSFYQVYGCNGSIPMTAWMVTQLGGMDKVKLYNDTEPASAFHYAYGRNKRNSDGSVPDTNKNRNFGWYLPGIRELEAAMTQQYTNFTDFQGNYYWSAAPADKNTDFTESNTNDYARATRIVKTTGTVEYAESHPKHYEGIWPLRRTVNAGPGHQKRSETNRIRVFYQIKN